MKKLFYIANVRIPTEKAHGLAIMKMCEALAEKGIEVELLVPNRKNVIKTDPFEFYKVKRNFKITRLPTVDAIPFGKVGFYLQWITFAISALFRSLFHKADVYYGRDELALFLINLTGGRTVWESHTARKGFYVSWLLNRSDTTVVISNGLKNYYISKKADPEKIHVLPSGIDLEEFSVDLTKEEARRKLDLPEGQKIVLYTGHLYSWKGTGILAKAAKEMENVLFVFVGGVKEDIEEFRETYGHLQNVRIEGQKPHFEIPTYLKSADALVIPNTSTEDVSRLYTSPLKLFEYMASGTPIIASDLSSIQEIVDERSAFLFLPDNFQSLAEIIKEVLDNPARATLRGKSAEELVKQYSWENRANKIVKFYEK